MRLPLKKKNNFYLIFSTLLIFESFNLIPFLFRAITKFKGIFPEHIIFSKSVLKQQKKRINSALSAITRVGLSKRCSWKGRKDRKIHSAINRLLVTSPESPKIIKREIRGLWLSGWVLSYARSRTDNDNLVAGYLKPRIGYQNWREQKSLISNFFFKFNQSIKI